MMSDTEEPVIQSLEYLQGLHDGLLLGKDAVRTWMNRKPKSDVEQLRLMFVYYLERLEEKKLPLIEASLI